MRGQGSWILVGVSGEKQDAGSREFLIEVWDIEKMKLVESYSSRPGGDLQEYRTNPKPTAEDRTSHNGSKGGAQQAIALLLQSQQKENASTNDQSIILESPFLHLENDPSIFTHTISCFLTGVNFYGPGYIAGTEGLEIYIGADDFAMPSVTQDTGFLLTGSRDCRIRFWDLNRVEKSRIICGAMNNDEKPVFR